tara:strand:- start:1626 stop:2258 length:633 start_codon:yes stop_codon:yes gene_type:complete
MKKDGDVDYTLESQAIERFLFNLLREGFEEEFLNAIGEHIRIEEEPTVPPAEVAPSTEPPADVNANLLELVFVDDGTPEGALVAIDEPRVAGLPHSHPMSPMTQDEVDALDGLSPEDFLNPHQYEVEALLQARVEGSDVDESDGADPSTAFVEEALIAADGFFPEGQEGLADAEGKLASFSAIDLAACEIKTTPAPNPFDRNWEETESEQ